MQLQAVLLVGLVGLSAAFPQLPPAGGQPGDQPGGHKWSQCKHHNKDEGSLDKCEAKRMKHTRVYYVVKVGETCQSGLPKSKDDLKINSPNDQCKAPGEEVRICSLTFNATLHAWVNSSSSPVSGASGRRSRHHKFDASNIDLAKVDLVAENFHGRCFLCKDPNDKEENDHGDLNECKESCKAEKPRIFYPVKEGETCESGIPKDPKNLTVGPPSALCQAPGDKIRICKLSKRVFFHLLNSSDPSLYKLPRPSPAPVRQNDDDDDESTDDDDGESDDDNTEDDAENDDDDALSNRRKSRHHGGDFDLSKFDLAKVELVAKNFKGRCYVCQEPQPAKSN